MKGKLFRAALSLALLAFLSAMAGRAEAGTPKDQLIIGMNMLNVLTLDPAGSTDANTHLPVTNMYDFLIMSDDVNPNTLNPCLAESWEEKDNGDIVFHLRKDVVFHSGNRMTADDVVYTLTRAVKAGVTATSFFVQWGYSKENVDSKIYKTDDYTVVMESVMPVTPHLKLLLLARQLGGILDSKLVMANEKNGDFGKAWLGANEAGSGPYTLTRYNPNDIIVLTRFDNYWGGPAKTGRLVMRHYAESQVVRLQMERGDLDIGYNLVASDFDALAKSENVSVIEVPYVGFYYICMSMRDEDLAKADVRRAIRYAIDYEGINNTILRYFGRMNRSFIPEGVAGYDPNIGNEHNLEKAKELLAKAGYKPGDLKKQFLTLSRSPEADLASIIQANLAEIGIEIEIIAGNGEQIYGPLRRREYDFGSGTTGLTGPGDPDAWVRFNVYNPDNSDEANLNNLQAWRQSVVVPGANELLEEASSISDQARRIELYVQAQKLYEDFGPAFIPISRRTDSTAVNKKVKNLVPNQTSTTRFNNVYKEE